jgi:hypothetical protein
LLNSGLEPNRIARTARSPSEATGLFFFHDGVAGFPSDGAGSVRSRAVNEGKLLTMHDAVALLFRRLAPIDVHAREACRRRRIDRRAQGVSLAAYVRPDEARSVLFL